MDDHRPLDAPLFGLVESVLLPLTEADRAGHRLGGQLAEHPPRTDVRENSPASQVVEAWCHQLSMARTPMAPIAARTIRIECPLDTVQRQFADIAHHEATNLHHNVWFTVRNESPTHCEYDQVTRQGPIKLRQTFHLDRSDPAHQVNTITAGPFSGGAITFDITEITPGFAEVTASLTSPKRSTRMFAPILRPMLGRALSSALAEDLADLESGRYS
jgi:hypothetical protein